MNMKNFLIFIILIIIVFSAYNYFTVPHYHAEFLVYKDGEKLDLNGIEHMYFAPCRVYEFGERELDEIDRAHLHDSVGDIVHVHDDGVTWRVLLSNLNIEGEFVGYNMSGENIEALLFLRIISDFLLIFFSSKESKYLLFQSNSKLFFSLAKDSRKKDELVNIFKLFSFWLSNWVLSILTITVFLGLDKYSGIILFKSQPTDIIKSDSLISSLAA